MCTHIKYFATSLQGATKTVKFVDIVPKMVGSATFCAHRNAIMPCNLKKNVLGVLSIVVHPYSNFSLCRQMAPLQNIKFQTANLPIFCAGIIVIF